jgi:hypothetical protein
VLRPALAQLGDALAHGFHFVDPALQLRIAEDLATTAAP